MKFLILFLLSFTLLATDNVIIPKGGNAAFFKDNTGNLMLLSIAYSTDGNGVLKLINSNNPVDDTLIIPKNSGKMYLQDANNNLLPAMVLYTTDGNGNIIPIPAVGGGGGGSYTFSAPLHLSGSTVSIPLADVTHDGYLSASNFSTFNSKENSGVAAALITNHESTYNHANIALNTAKRHDAVTIGTANGLSLSGQQLSLVTASASTVGALSSTDWSTFNSKQNTVSASAPISFTSNNISMAASSDSVNGYLLSTDHATFNNKMEKNVPATFKTIYMAVNGINSLDCGNIGKPCASIVYAIANIIAPPYDQDHHWVIRLAPGRYIETADIVLPPYVDLIGDGHRSAYVRVSGGTNSIRPSTAWATSSTWTTLRGFYAGGSTVLNFDLQAIGGSNANIVIQDIWSNVTNIFKGRNAGGGDYLEVYDWLSIGGLTMDMIHHQIQGLVLVGDLNISATLSSCDGTFVNSNFNGNVVINGTNTNAIQFANSPFAAEGTTLTVSGSAILTADGLSIPKPEYQTMAEANFYCDGGLVCRTNFQPTCNLGHRDWVWNIRGGTGVADIMQICQKNASDVYAWITK